MAAPDFLIVWDLDHTLGVFDAIADVYDETQPVTVKLRQGIDDALVRLSDEGFSHSVLTLASPSYAQLALLGTSLRRHFLEIAAAGQRPKGDVEGVAHTFGIPFEQRPDRMLFIGDHPLYDPPQDPRVVFHLERYAVRRPAEQVASLVLSLRELGEGSLRRGFDEVASRGGAEQVRKCALDGVGSLLLLPRDNGCQVLVFDDKTLSEEDISTAVSFVPAEQIVR